MTRWWTTARTAAAADFGRRHSSAFATFEVVKRLLPAVATGALLGGICWAAVIGWQWAGRSVSGWGAGWATHAAPTVVGLLVLAVIVAVVAWAVRRWMWLIDVFLPLEHTTAWIGILAVAALGSGAAVVWWAAS